MEFPALTYLAEKNPHPRDERIEFDEGPHIYTIDGTDTGYTSVTTWNHCHFEEFDADKIITKMMSSRNWVNSKYYGMTREEIKKSWDDNRDAAATAGTKMHYDIESYYNNIPPVNDSIEYKYFKAFEEARLDSVKGFGRTLVPYRTEWTVFHEELRISGSIDMIYENTETGHLEIYDWKRSREIKKTTPFGKSSVNPVIDHIPDTNYWHYALQLNTYAYILETKYDKKVDALYLVCLHPENKNGSYIRISVPRLREDMDNLVAQRLEKLRDSTDN